MARQDACLRVHRMAMHERVNRQVRLKSRPSGIPQAEHFEIVEAPVPDLSDGQVLVRNIYLSVDPAMRGWVSAVANYSEPVALGAVMRSLAVGRVEESRSSDFHPGEYVTGMFGWQDYAVVDAGAIERKVGGSGLPISTSLGVLGLNGLTAYFALLEVGQPKAGETVVVSTAAGAVGSCVGQIAKIKGCRTVGIAGGPDKVRLCREEFRYDSAVDYRADDFESALDAACPEGVDVYFDNTAGPISDSVMRRLNGRSTGGHLRHGVDRELGSATPGTTGRASSSRQTRANAGVSHLRPCPAQSRGTAGTRELGAQRTDPLSRGHPRRNRAGTGFDRRAVPRRESRQASDSDRSRDPRLETFPRDANPRSPPPDRVVLAHQVT